MKIILVISIYLFQSWWLYWWFQSIFLGGEELSAHEHCLCCKYWYKNFCSNSWYKYWGKHWKKTFAWILSSNVGAMLVQILFVLMTICWLVSQVAPVLLLDINNSNNNNNNDNNNNDNNNNSIYLLLSQVALVLSLDPPLTWLYLKFSIRWFYWLIDSFNFEYISRFTAFFRTLVLSLDWLLPHGWLLPSQWCFSTSY